MKITITPQRRQILHYLKDYPATVGDFVEANAWRHENKAHVIFCALARVDLIRAVGSVGSRKGGPKALKFQTTLLGCTLLEAFDFSLADSVTIYMERLIAYHNERQAKERVAA